MCEDVSILLGVFEPDTWHISTFIIVPGLVHFLNRFSHLICVYCILHHLYQTEDLQSVPSSFIQRFFHSFQHTYPASVQRQNLGIDYFCWLVGWFSLLLKNILLLMDLVNAKASCLKLTLHTLAMAARDFRHRSGSRLRGGVRGQRCVFIYEGTHWHLCLGYNVNRKMGREKKIFLTCIWHLFPGWSPEQDRPKQVDHKYI